MGLETKLSEEKLVDIQSMLITRFNLYKSNRKPFDNAIEYEVDIAEGVDRDLDDKEDWKVKDNVNYLWAVNQTITARLSSSIFGHNDYLKVYVERDVWRDKQNEITQWMQEEMDRIRLRYKSRDFLEDALKKRTSFLQLRPVPLEKQENDGKEWKIEFDVLDFYDVWFDTKAVDVMDTDWFVRKLKKFYEVVGNKNYFNRDEILYTNYDLMDEPEKHDEYQAKHRGADKDTISYYTERGGEDKTVELLEWYGVLDLAEGRVDDPDHEPDFCECIVTLANRNTIVRIEKNNLDELRRPRLIFPIRPIRQSRSLIAKSTAQITGNLSKNINETNSNLRENFEQLVKLLWKYRRGANIDITALFAGGGNMVDVDEMDDVQLFDVKNMMNEAMAMKRDQINDLYNVTGASYQTQGMSAPGSQTASEVRGNTEQAMFKFMMMAENVAMDLSEFINYYMILALKFNTGVLKRRYPKLIKFFSEIDIGDIEQGLVLDIGLKDLTQRKDVEQNQWANMVGVILPLLQQSGGNTTELLKRLFEVFNIHNTNALLEPESPDQIALKLANNPQLAQAVMQMLSQLTQQAGGGGGGGGMSPEAVPGGDTVERTASENISTGGAAG